MSWYGFIEGSDSGPFIDTNQLTARLIGDMTAARIAREELGQPTPEIEDDPQFTALGYYANLMVDGGMIQVSADGDIVSTNRDLPINDILTQGPTGPYAAILGVAVVAMYDTPDIYGLPVPETQASLPMETVELINGIRNFMQGTPSPDSPSIDPSTLTPEQFGILSDYMRISVPGVSVSYSPGVQSSQQAIQVVSNASPGVASLGSSPEQGWDVGQFVNSVVTEGYNTASGMADNVNNLPVVQFGLPTLAEVRSSLGLP